MRFVRLSCMGSMSCPDLSSGQTYQEKQALFFDEMIGYADSLSFGMRQRGYDSHEIIYDCKELQSAWTEEQGVNSQDVVLKQLEYLRPDILYLQDIYGLPEGMHAEIKKRITSIKMLIIFRGYPGTNRAFFRAAHTADLLLVGSPMLLERCCKEGLNPKLFYHFFDERVLERLPQQIEKNASFVFCGSSGLGYGMGHSSRYHLLEALLRERKIEAWLDEIMHPRSFYPMLKNEFRAWLVPLITRWPFKLLQYLPMQQIENLVSDIHKYKEEGYPLILPRKRLSDMFPGQTHEPLFGIEMYTKLAQSKVILNKHANLAAKTADNIRLFQTTGVGSCLLTDTGSNLADLFEPDKEIVTYASIEECFEKAQYLLTHDKEREAIAHNGQARTLRDHTLSKRCQHLDEYICLFMRKRPT